MPLTVGGGVRTVEDIRELLLAGADKVSINTAAVDESATSCARRRTNSAASASSSPSTPSRCRRRASATAGRSSPMAGATPTGIDAVAFARQVAALGAGELLVTSMDRDGTKAGYDLALIRAIADAVPVPVIASGRRRHPRPSRRRACATAMPAPCSPPRSSISAPTRSPRPRRTWRQAGLQRCGSTGDRAGRQAAGRDDRPSPSPISNAHRRRARRGAADEILHRQAPRRGARAGAPRSLARRPSRRSIAAVQGDAPSSSRRPPTCSIICWSCCRAPAFRCSDVMSELERRTAQSGLAEKARARLSLDVRAGAACHGSAQHGSARRHRPTDLSPYRVSRGTNGRGCAPTRR